MLFFQSFETLAQPVFQKMIFYKSIHCLLSLIKLKHALPCIWNCIQPVKMPVSLPEKKNLPRLAFPATKNAPCFPLAHLCG